MNFKLKNQDGLVSIIVTMIIMSIVTLIVIGFAIIMRREQRSALDRQLSTQAFYAAESGVNDAIDYYINNATASDITNCPPDSLTRPISAAYNNDLGNNIRYTCVLTNSQPDELTYDVISEQQSTVLPIRAANAAEIDRLKISWEAQFDPDDKYRPNVAAFDLPPKSTWGDTTGIVRATVIRTDDGFDRSELINDSRTFFLYPKLNSGNNSIGYGNSADQGVIVPGNCSNTQTPRRCSVTISIAGDPQLLYLRLKAIYNKVAVTIEAFEDGSSTPLELVGAQRVIDVTGRAADILRRIQVRKPINPSGVFPEFAIESMDSICKRLVTRPGNSSLDTTGITGATTSCQLN